MRELGIGIIGTGFMGKAHAIAYRTALSAFPDIPTPRLVAVADVNGDAAKKAAHQYGFETATGDWKQLIANPAVPLRKSMPISPVSPIGCQVARS